MRFIDAHHHLWDLGHCRYPWLMARGVKRFFGDPAPIQNNYLVSDFLDESSEWTPEKSVHIQVGAEVSDSLKESQWLQQVSGTADSRGMPNAIVAFADLTADNAEQQLSLQAAVSNVRGIRQIVGRHPQEDRQTSTGSLLNNARWCNGLALLEKYNLSFDLQLIPPQYALAFDVFSAMPGLPVAICHCGSPWDQTKDGLDHWRKGMQQFAQLPNVYCKVSGLGMFNHDWTDADILPLILGAIEIFGVNRVMFGSNFPVDSLYNRYAKNWSAYERITSGFSDSERKRLFYQNAANFYRI